MSVAEDKEIVNTREIMLIRVDIQENVILMDLSCESRAATRTKLANEHAEMELEYRQSSLADWLGTHF